MEAVVPGCGRGECLKYVRNRHDPAKQEELFRQEDPVLDHRKETMLAMAALSGDERYSGLAEEEEKEDMGVCKMLDYIEARGEAHGEARGMMLRLIEQVVKKYQRGLTVESIAEQVEEAVSVVEAICKVIRECGSGSTTEEIYARLYPAEEG